MVFNGLVNDRQWAFIFWNLLQLVARSIDNQPNRILADIAELTTELCRITDHAINSAFQILAVQRFAMYFYCSIILYLLYMLTYFADVHPLVPSVLAAQLHEWTVVVSPLCRQNAHPDPVHYHLSLHWCESRFEFTVLLFVQFIPWLLIFILPLKNRTQNLNPRCLTLPSK